MDLDDPGQQERQRKGCNEPPRRPRSTHESSHDSSSAAETPKRAMSSKILAEGQKKPRLSPGLRVEAELFLLHVQCEVIDHERGLQRDVFHA